LEEDPELFRDVIDAFVDAIGAVAPDRIVCIESFGYVFGAPVAYRLRTKLALARRAGKLPRDVHREGYDMIYATDKELELHRDAVDAGERVVIVDDVLASGGSALAAVRLVERCGGMCAQIACVAEVPILRTAPARVELEQRGIGVVALAELVV
jgi:adenine phosphoribosyltransferase